MELGTTPVSLFRKFADGARHHPSELIPWYIENIQLGDICERRWDKAMKKVVT
jgi:hypothetical protein